MYGVSCTSQLHVKLYELNFDSAQEASQVISETHREKAVAENTNETLETFSSSSIKGNPYFTQKIGALRIVEILEVPYGSPIEELQLKKGQHLLVIAPPHGSAHCSTRFNLQRAEVESHFDIELFVLNSIDQTGFFQRDSFKITRTPRKLSVSLPTEELYKPFTFEQLFSAQRPEKKESQSLRAMTVQEGLLITSLMIRALVAEFINDLLQTIAYFFCFLVEFFESNSTQPFRDQSTKRSASFEATCPQISPFFLNPCARWRLKLLAFARLITLKTLFSLLPLKNSDSFMFLKILYTGIVPELYKRKE